METNTNRTVEIEVLASSIRRQDQRLRELILGLESATLDPRSAEPRLRAIEQDLRRPPAVAA